MVAPNLVNVSSIYGKTVRLALTTSAQTLLNNPASSGKVLKVNSLYITNIDGSNSADATVNHYDQDDIGGTAVSMCAAIPVPGKVRLDVISKDVPLYLEEDKSLGALASANGDLVAVISYEELG